MLDLVSGTKSYYQGSVVGRLSVKKCHDSTIKLLINKT